MNKITSENIELFNRNLRYEDPEEIIQFAFEITEKPILTTSFGPYSAALIHAVVSIRKDIKVIWCDTGYNTDATYKHANRLIDRFKLNIEIFTPAYTVAFINNTLGKPDVNHPNYPLFAERMKLQPFKKALQKHQPDLWFTNLRKAQTVHRNSLNILSFSESGILKVSPFYHFSDEDIMDYLNAHKLPVERDYFDPVKARQHRECGIHLRN